jgi:hypothetical protein
LSEVLFWKEALHGQGEDDEEKEGLMVDGEERRGGVGMERDLPGLGRERDSRVGSGSWGWGSDTGGNNK